MVQIKSDIANVCNAKADWQVVDEWSDLSLVDGKVHSNSNMGLNTEPSSSIQEINNNNTVSSTISCSSPGKNSEVTAKIASNITTGNYYDSDCEILDNVDICAGSVPASTGFDLTHAPESKSALLVTSADKEEKYSCLSSKEPNSSKHEVPPSLNTYDESNEIICLSEPGSSIPVTLVNNNISCDKKSVIGTTTCVNEGARGLKEHGKSDDLPSRAASPIYDRQLEDGKLSGETEDSLEIAKAIRSLQAVSEELKKRRRTGEFPVGIEYNFPEDLESNGATSSSASEHHKLEERTTVKSSPNCTGVDHKGDNANRENIDPEPKKLKHYEQPFVSSNPDENTDNNNPDWEYLRKLSTDNERYRVVKNVWQNDTIPNPNTNLSMFSNPRRFKNSKLFETTRKRKRNNENEAPASKRRKVVNDIQFFREIVEDVKYKVGRDYTNDINKNYGRTNPKLEKTYWEKLMQLDSTVVEADALLKFYSTLPNQQTMTQNDIRREQDCINSIYEAFSRLYKWSCRYLLY